MLLISLLLFVVLFLFLFVLICFDFFFYYFFSQAEDGIRDLTVTGVQTCALPIWRTFNREGTLVSSSDRSVCNGGRACSGFAFASSDVQELLRGQDYHISGRLFGGRWYRRSEERRVGKVCGVGRERREYLSEQSGE